MLILTELVNCSGSSDNVIIPDVSGASNRFPIVRSSGASCNNLTVSAGATITIGNGSAGADNLTVNGTTDIDGSGVLTIASDGTFNADGTFDATGSNVTFSGAGDLVLGSTVTGLGTTKSTGTVTYDRAGVQNVVAVDYYFVCFWVTPKHLRVIKCSQSYCNGAGTVLIWALII